MENPLESESGEVKAQKPEANPVKILKKKSFFTVGKILAVFGVLLIVGTVVGAIIYSRSSERLQGQVVTYDRSGSITDLANRSKEAQLKMQLTEEEAAAEEAAEKAKSNALTAEVGTSNRCDTTNHWKENRKGSGNKLALFDDNVVDDVYFCVCEDDYVASSKDEPCVPLDYCKLTNEELNAYMSSLYVNPNTKKHIEATLKDVGLSAYQEGNCKVEMATKSLIPDTSRGDITDGDIVNINPRTPIETDRAPATPNDIAKLKIQPKMQITPLEINPDDIGRICTRPLSSQTYNGTSYCMCSSGEYPEFDIVEGVTAECKPFKCETTQEELDKIKQNISSILANQGINSRVAPNITEEFSKSYQAWMGSTENCQPEKQKESTCDDFKLTLGNAYFSHNWDSYDATLRQLEEKGCFKPCDDYFYKIIMYLSTEQRPLANEFINKYLEACTDCDLTYGLFSAYAEVLRNVEKKRGGEVPEKDLIILKKLVESYFDRCQCPEWSESLKSPTFPANEYFKGRSSSGIRTAYAQSSSSSVASVITDAYTEQCTTPTPTPKDKDNSCKSLIITSPDSGGLYEISGKLDSSKDHLKFIVDNDALIATYHITSKNTVLNNDDTDITTTNNNIGLSEGPSAGGEDVIKVVAIGKDKKPIDACSAEIKIKRSQTPPPPKQPLSPSKTECRSLEIVSPGNASQSGVPTIELSSGSYTNKVLEIKVDADAGSVKDYKYSSSNGYIKFNDKNTLYTTDKKVVMKGVIPAGHTDTISIWARDSKTSSGIQTCHDGYVVTAPKKEEPTPPKKYIPSSTITEEPPTPPIEEVVVPKPETTPAPEPTVSAIPAVIHHVSTPRHAASEPAPKMPSNGPGVLIYLVGAGLGGALLKRRKK